MSRCEDRGEPGAFARICAPWHLPAYSPNLNLIERLWKFLRKEALQKWQPSFEEMQRAVAEVLDNLPRYRQQLQTLMTERFHLTPVASTIIVGVGEGIS
jgi:hypothetical protein